LSLENVYSQWNVQEDKDTGEDIEAGEGDGAVMDTVLRDINFTLEQSDKVAVIGKVGCGKTSLLLTILKELCLIKGTIKVSSRNHVSYAEQNPLIMTGTVRSNILFGASLDQKRYDRVIKACALVDDFK
jgi:ABC-type multidrug transport system fused ATPase/permease subunit